MRHRNYRLNEGSDIDAVQRKLKKEYSDFQDLTARVEESFRKNDTTMLAKACANLVVNTKLLAVLSLYAECLEETGGDSQDAQDLLNKRINDLASSRTITRTTAASYVDTADDIDFWLR